MIERAPKSAFLFLCASFLFAGSLAVAWHPIRETFWLATHDDAYTHLLLILPLAAALVWLDWRSVESSVTPGLRPGLVLLGASLVIAGLVHWRVGLAQDEQLAGNMLALVIWWIGAFVLCFGPRVSQSLLFPLVFSFLLVPLPRFVVNEIVSWLQQASAFVAHILFSVARVPTTQRGLLLDIPGLTVEVAAECSSIRSSSMLLVSTIILAQLFLRTPWKKWLVIALAIPISVAKNGLRIFTIAMLGTRVDPSYLEGRLHHQGGIVFFTIGLAAIVAMLVFLRRNDREPFPQPAPKPSAG